MSIQNDLQLRLHLTPFELQDSMDIIQSYLREDHATILSCCLVSKAFNQIFRPLLWTTLEFSENKESVPSLNALQENIRLVKSISFLQERKPSGYIPAHFTALAYPRLEEIGIHFELLVEKNWYSSLFDDEPPQGLFQRHEQTLQRVTLSGFLICDIGFQLWRELGALPALKELELSAMEIRGREANEVFWKMCAQPQLEKLVLSHVKFLDSRQAALEQELRNQGCAGRHPSRLQEIAISSSQLDLEMYKRLVEMMTRSPDLKKLRVSNIYSTPSHYLVFPPWADPTSWYSQPPCTWHHLTDLDLCSTEIRDDRLIATVLGTVSSCGLERVDLMWSGFGQASLDVLLQRHARTLTDLDLRDCEHVTSSMVNQILCTCERLVFIHAEMIEVTDVVRPWTSSSISSSLSPSSSSSSCLQAPCQNDVSQPWVCKDLQDWRIGISVGSVSDEVTETIHFSRLMFARLAGLKKLRRLVIPPPNREGLHELQFRLDRGLEQLKTLQELEMVSSTPQSSEEDIAWVMDTFPRLQ